MLQLNYIFSKNLLSFRSWRGFSNRVTVDEAEVKKFALISGQWWQDKSGPFVGLHRMNMVRVPLLRDTLLRHTPIEDLKSLSVKEALSHKTMLDVGCGGGILAEAMARLGANVLGIDAAKENIEAAKYHASLDKSLGDRIKYEAITVEELSQKSSQFDLVVSSEVVEHVADVPTFVNSLVSLVKPGGYLVLTTMNRTPKSFFNVIFAAEYVLGVVPPRTHSWSKFLSPEELADIIKPHFSTIDNIGFDYNPLKEEWKYSTSCDVNYAIVARKNLQ